MIIHLIRNNKNSNDFIYPINNHKPHYTVIHKTNDASYYIKIIKITYSLKLSNALIYCL